MMGFFVCSSNDFFACSPKQFEQEAHVLTVSRVWKLVVELWICVPSSLDLAEAADAGTCDASVWSLCHGEEGGRCNDGVSREVHRRCGEEGRAVY